MKYRTILNTKKQVNWGNIYSKYHIKPFDNGHAYIQSLEIQRLYISPLVQLATVHFGLYTVAEVAWLWNISNFYLQLYERDYIQLRSFSNCMKGIIYSWYYLSRTCMYTLECIWVLWDICILMFLMKDNVCYPYNLLFFSDFFSLSLYHYEQSFSQSVNQ